jgi:LmbE family N-acetylglucosaminyl deacetylase
VNRDRVAALGTILGVWAHPDDEAFLSAGLMAMAVDSGSRVVCVTATRGEAGTPDPEHCPPEAMAAIREREMAESLAILGVREHHWLDYRDGECADVEVDEAAAKIVPIIEEVRPDTILTFGPEGFTDHPDHKAVNTWLLDAHHRSRGATARRIHFAAQTPDWVDEHGAVMLAAGVFPPGFPPRTPVRELSIDAFLPTEVNERKVRALRAQGSQIESLVQALGLPTFTTAFATERFRRAPIAD